MDKFNDRVFPYSYAEIKMSLQNDLHDKYNFRFDELCNFYILENSYEDFNIKVESNDSLYIIKIFSTNRTKKDIERYKKNIKSLNSEFGGIFIPTVVLNKYQELFSTLTSTNLEYLVYNHLKGYSLFDTNYKIKKKCINHIVNNLYMFHSSKFIPEKFDDKWCIVKNVTLNINNKDNYFKKCKRVLTDSASILGEVSSRVLCHTDLSSMNIIRSDNNNFYLIDFSSLRLGFRPYDLAVFSAECIFPRVTTKNDLFRKVKHLIGQYEYFSGESFTKVEFNYFWSVFAGAFYTNLHLIGSPSNQVDKYWHSLSTKGVNFVKQNSIIDL